MTSSPPMSNQGATPLPPPQRSNSVASISPPATPLTGMTLPLPSPTPTPIHGSFYNPQLFHPIYQRNNKKGNIKNLRCFPSCSSDSHKMRGFCGRSVLVSFDLPASSSSTARTNKFYSFSEFLPITTEEEEENAAVQQRTSLEEMQSRLRTKMDPTKPLLAGTAQFVHLDKHKLWFEFNTELKGWHYSWESNKHKCDTKHHLVCTLYEEEEPGSNTLVLRGKCASPEFILFCRRRKRFQLDPMDSTATATAMETPAKRAKADLDEETEEDEAATEALLAFMSSGSNSNQV